MKLQLTQKHIDEGNFSDTSNCPFALAIKEATGRPCFIGTSRVYFTDGKLPSDMRLSKNAEESILKACSTDTWVIGRGMTPMEFELLAW